MIIIGKVIRMVVTDVVGGILEDEIDSNVEPNCCYEDHNGII